MIVVLGLFIAGLALSTAVPQRATRAAAMLGIAFVVATATTTPAPPATIDLTILEGP